VARNLVSARVSAYARATFKEDSMRFRGGAAIAIGTLVLGLAGCGKGGGKCEQAVNKGMEMASAMMGAMGGGDKDAMAKAKAEMEKQKPEAIKKCDEALKNDKDGKVAKALDCVIGAKDLEAMTKCEGADAIMK
jgi:hypothetical protein